MQLFLGLCIGLFASPSFVNAKVTDPEVAESLIRQLHAYEFGRYLSVAKKLLDFVEGQDYSDTYSESGKRVRAALVESLKELSGLLKSGSFHDLSDQEQRYVLLEFFGLRYASAEDGEQLRFFEVHRKFDGMDDFEELKDNYLHSFEKSKMARRSLSDVRYYLSLPGRDLHQFSAAVKRMPLHHLSESDFNGLAKEVWVVKAELSPTQTSIDPKNAVTFESQKLANDFEPIQKQFKAISCLRKAAHSAE